MLHFVVGRSGKIDSPLAAGHQPCMSSVNSHFNVLGHASHFEVFLWEGTGNHSFPPRPKQRNKKIHEDEVNRDSSSLN